MEVISVRTCFDSGDTLVSVFFTATLLETQRELGLPDANVYSSCPNLHVWWRYELTDAQRARRIYGTKQTPIALTCWMYGEGYC